MRYIFRPIEQAPGLYQPKDNDGPPYVVVPHVGKHFRMISVEDDEPLKEGDIELGGVAESTTVTSQVCQGMQVPREYLEPALSTLERHIWFADALLNPADKDAKIDIPLPHKTLKADS